MTAHPEHLFVYGTLRSDAGGAAHGRFMRGMRRVGRASIAGRLYDAGWYPAAVPSDDPDERIAGELYAMDADAADGLLAALDAYEGCHADAPDESLFVRRIVQAAGEGGDRRAAWAYFFSRPVGGLPRVASGDWICRERGA